MTRNAPGPKKAEGVKCLLAGDTDAFITERLRLQHLAGLGFPRHRAALIAPMAYGEGRA